MPVHALINFGQ